MKKAIFWMLGLAFVFMFTLTACAVIPQAAEVPTQAPPTPEPAATPTLILEAALVTCDDAAGYIKNDELELARKAYEAITLATPGAKCALQGLVMLDLLEKDAAAAPVPTEEPTPNYATVVPALLNIGDFSGAWGKLQEGVANKVIDEKENFGYGLWKVWMFAKNAAGEILVPLLLAVFLTYLLISFLRYITRWVIDIEDLKPGSAAGITAQVCQSISNKIEENLYRYYEKGVNNTPRLVTKAIQPPDLPASVSEKASGVWNFLIKLFPQRTITVNGFLEYHKTKGVGISLAVTLLRNQAVMGHITIWEADFNIPILEIKTPDNPVSEVPEKPKDEVEPINDCLTLDYVDHCRELTKIASAWVYWQICQVRRTWFSKKPNPIEIFGTNDVESYLNFKMAECKVNLWDEKLDTNSQTKAMKDIIINPEKTGPEKEKSKMYLSAAIKKDQHNSFALMNMAYRFHKIDNYKKTSKAKCAAYESLLNQIMFNNRTPSLVSVMAHYSLGDHLLSLKKSKLKSDQSIHELQKECREQIFDNHFRYAFENSRTIKGLSSTAKLAMQIPYLINWIIFPKKRLFKAFIELVRIESAKKRVLRKGNVSEHNLDIFYNLSCLYSMSSTYKSFATQSTNDLLKQFYYSEDESLIVSKPEEFIGFAARNLEYAFQCNFQRVFQIYKADTWLEKVYSDKKGKLMIDKIVDHYHNLHEIVAKPRSEGNETNPKPGQLF